MTWIAIGVGGALGSMLRHAVNVLFARGVGSSVPYATAAVNLAGCVVIGALAGLSAAERISLSPFLRAFVFVGVLGGFTTFSSFALDTVALTREGQPLEATLNVVFQVTVGLAGAFAAYALAVRWGQTTV